MFSELQFSGVRDLVGRGVYCAAVNTTDDKLEISAIFLKNGKMIDSDESLWFYNSFLNNGKSASFICSSKKGVVGFHLNGVYSSKANDTPEKAHISGILNKVGVNKGTVIGLSKDWFRFIDADEVTFVACSKNRFHHSELLSRFLDYDNFNSSGRILSETNVSDIYPNATSIQLFSLFSNSSVETVSRASNMALLQDYVKAVS